MKKDFVILVNNRITFIEDMKFIKSYKTINKRVFVTFINDTDDDFYFDNIEIREQTMKTNKKFMYICQLSDNDQQAIKEDLILSLSNISWINLDEEIENAMSRKLVDLEDTIDISKYL